MAGVRIIGVHAYPGTMLVGAMLRARAEGVGVFMNYLGENNARKEAWEKLTRLSPKVVVARASLSERELRAAGIIIEQAAENEQRKGLLAQIAAAYLLSQGTLFGLPPGRQPSIDAASLEKLLAPQLPKKELMMEYNPFQGVISRDQVTNEQYGIFLAQTGCREPYYWDDPDFGKAQPDRPVIGVDYVTDAAAFSSWLGRAVPTTAELMFARLAKEPKAITAGVSWEWNSTEGRQGFQAVSALSSAATRYLPAGLRNANNITFRVAGI